jgi:ribosomal subunit interface protein
MQVQIAGKQIDLSTALKERIATGLEAGVSKYFDRTGEASVFVSKPARDFQVDCSVHLPSGVTLQAHGEGHDAYSAFEQSLDKIEKRVRRYHRRLKDHHKDRRELQMVDIAERVIASDDAEVEEDLGTAPAIVAETDVKLKTMTVSMAVMQLELTDSPALMFRNASNESLNMVFRRPDGNVGWVDPGA